MSLTRFPPWSTLLIMALLGHGAGHADPVYSWTDSNGNLTFSDRPPLDPEKVKLKEGGKKPETGKDDDPRTAIAREDARRKRLKENNRAASAWRCKELEEQYQKTLVEQEKIKGTSSAKTRAIQTDAENYKVTLERMCK